MRREDIQAASSLSGALHELHSRAADRARIGLSNSPGNVYAVTRWWNATVDGLRERLGLDDHMVEALDGAIGSIVVDLSNALADAPSATGPRGEALMAAISASKSRWDGWARSAAVTMTTRAMSERKLASDQAGRPGAMKVWRSHDDGRTRGDHRELDGMAVSIQRPFVTEDGDMIMYPGDPGASPRQTINCRCELEIR